MTNFMDGDVFKSLNKGMIAAVAASTRPDIPIAFPGITFVPPAEEIEWWEVVIIPNNPENEQWGENRSYAGLFRLILHYPVNNMGMYEPLEVVESVCGYFTKARDLNGGGVTVRITTPPLFIGDLPSGHETQYPVSMRYRHFQP